MAAPPAVKMPGTPKPWMNRGVRALLATPALRGPLGKLFAVITITGAKSGKRYTTPVQHLDVDGHYVVLSQTMRRWWRNLRRFPEVELRIAGRTVSGHATIAEGTAARELLAACLTRNPRVARFYGIRADQDGTIDPAALDRLLEHVVVIDIRPAL